MVPMDLIGLRVVQNLGDRREKGNVLTDSGTTIEVMREEER